MKINCLGDSLTYGYGVGRREAWTALASGMSGHDFVNKGINGDTTGGMLARFTEDVVKEAPGGVLLMGGANDFIMGEPVERVQANMSAMVHQACSYGILPVIGIGIQIKEDMIRTDWKAFADFEVVREKIGVYRQWVLSFAKTFKIDYIDMYKAFADYDLQGGRGFYSDGLHLNEAGNRYFAEIISEEWMKLTHG